MPISATHTYGHLKSTNTWDAAQTLSAALNLTSGQITFPGTQAASAGANTLDDYEEGTWTPVLGGSGGQSGQTYATQTGAYVKVGKNVCAWFRTEFSVKGTITGTLQVQGLPFTIENITSQRAFMPLFFEAMVTSVVCFGCIIVPNGTVVSVYMLTAAATSMSTLTTADVGNSTNVTGCIIYRASA